MMTFRVANHRPRDIDINREAGTATISWADYHVSTYSLEWLRANCPCATCREQRHEAAQDGASLTLTDAPPPTAELASAVLVGGYAIQIEWADGHSAGIYAFSALRQSCPCDECSPDGSPQGLD